MTVFRRPRMPRGGRLVICAVMCGVLAVGGLTELVMRQQAAGRFKDRMNARLGTSVDVAFGRTPVVLQLARGAFPHVEVEGDDATFRRFTGVDFHADLEHVVRSGGSLAVHSSQVRAEMSAESLAETVTSATGLGARGGGATVTPDPDSEELVIRTGPAGRLSVAMRPELDGEGIRLERTAVRFGEREVPEGLADQLLAQAPRELDLSGLPLDLQPSRLTVTERGLRLDLRGRQATFEN
ncbi:DUF2993 domain-containing protein [Streptomyces sp. GC420]|uniref:LmeA family phospholipid-binding protein n=1 Tax=Streptomyces sp. GC420 TaxID=2697568 RepID=UPI001414D190|nr:DUF2993 domain-containing protein [Streptomyces sp. GC420]NBM20010.1 LmeA family phospholipid-binding protein [Streptomyces sp. GC420]